MQQSLDIGKTIRDTGEGRSKRDAQIGVTGFWGIKLAFRVAAWALIFACGFFGHRFISACWGREFVFVPTQLERGFGARQALSGLNSTRIPLIFRFASDLARIYFVLFKPCRLN